MVSRLSMIALAAAALVALRSDPAAAGCGCNKPPPPAAIVRPTFASPGDTVTFFPPENRYGRYDVRFFNGGDFVAFRDVKAVYKRDLAEIRAEYDRIVREGRGRSDTHIIIARARESANDKADKRREKYNADFAKVRAQAEAARAELQRLRDRHKELTSTLPE